MATDAAIIKRTCDILVCKAIKNTGITKVNNGINWIQQNSTQQDRDDLVAAVQSRDVYLYGAWWKRKMEEYFDQLHRPDCEAKWADGSLSAQEVNDIFGGADSVNCWGG